MHRGAVSYTLHKCFEHLNEGVLSSVLNGFTELTIKTTGVKEKMHYEAVNGLLMHVLT